MKKGKEENEEQRKSSKTNTHTETKISKRTKLF
jgi:hypothetical protein